MGRLAGTPAPGRSAFPLFIWKWARGEVKRASSDAAPGGVPIKDVTGVRNGLSVDDDRAEGESGPSGLVGEGGGGGVRDGGPPEVSGASGE